MARDQTEIAGTPSRGSGQVGMTLIEVMVAMLLLLVGVFGVIGLLDTGNQVTKQNLTRDVASGLAREQLERARELTYVGLHDASDVAGLLSGRIVDSADPDDSDAVFTTTRRGVQYTTTISSCVLDDPSDGLGGTPGVPCDPLDPDEGGGGSIPSVPGDSTLNLNVLGIEITGGGTVVSALCGAGIDASPLGPLLGGGGLLDGLVGSGAGVVTCDDGTQKAVDSQPSDATRVATTVEWDEPSSGSVSQRTLIVGPRTCPTPDPDDPGRCLDEAGE